MKKLILCSLFAILTSCTAAPTAPATQSIDVQKNQTEEITTQAIKEKAKSCMCTRLWMPVCGEDKKTYANACEADCAGVKHTGGACAETK